MEPSTFNFKSKAENFLFYTLTFNGQYLVEVKKKG